MEFSYRGTFRKTCMTASLLSFVKSLMLPCLTREHADIIA